MEPEKKAALLAMKELERGGTILPADDALWAEEYAKQAFEDLETLPSGYNPKIDASSKAMVAVVEFVKAKLRGINPESSEGYVRASRAWLHAAAVDYYE